MCTPVALLKDAVMFCNTEVRLFLAFETPEDERELLDMSDDVCCLVSSSNAGSSTDGTLAQLKLSKNPARG